MDILSQTEMPTFILRYLQELETLGRQPSTIKRYKYDIDDFFKWWEIRNGKEISFDEWCEIPSAEYKAFSDELLIDRNYSQQTYKRIISVLTRLCVYYHRQGFNVEFPNINVSRNKPKKLTKKDFVELEDLERLKLIIPAYNGLSEIQLPSRTFLINRNLCIVILFAKYGLTIQEVVAIDMKDLNFIQKTIQVSSVTSQSREIKMDIEDSKLLYSYYKDIPEPVRPKQYTGDPFFISFDFWRGTYHWVYEDKQPKRLTIVSIQKMLRQETRRAGLERGITPQHLRNTAIITKLKDGVSKEEIQKEFGFRSILSVERYINFLNNTKNEGKIQT